MLRLRIINDIIFTVCLEMPYFEDFILTFASSYKVTLMLILILLLWLFNPCTAKSYSDLVFYATVWRIDNICF